MNQKEFEKVTKSIQDKLGKETVSLIADDLGKLITDNSAMNDLVKSKDEEISRLNQDKEVLITANGNLLQQVAMGDESSLINKKQNEPEEPKKPFNYREVFDSKGNFKR
jgi:hypothetical protein